MRADRLLSIVLLLQRYGRLTAADLAHRLEVSERTIYRDIEALSVSGIPVSMDRGNGGGCSLPRDYQSAANLTESELQALVVSSSKLLNDLGLKSASESAILKLLGVLPLPTRLQVESIADRVYVDATKWNMKEEPVPCMQQVQAAVLNGKQIRFRYQKSDSSSQRTVGALGLVCKGSVWYLVAESSDEQIKSYRLSRIVEAEVLEFDAHRPVNFILDEFWRESMASFPTRLPRYPVTVSCSPEHVPYLYNAGHWSSVESVDFVDSLNCRVLMYFERDKEALQCLLEHSPNVRVIEPVELKRKIISVLEQALESYQTAIV